MKKIVIESVSAKKQLKEFIMMEWKIYNNDPYWVPHLNIERFEYLDRRKNPFFKHGDAELFLARYEGEVVGRISAQVDYNHNKLYSEKTGFFGFFESIDSKDVSTALLDSAKNWLKSKGMEVMRGPFSFNINHESGLLIEGFDSKPFIMMCHNPPYYQNLLEDYGLKKVKDLFAFKYNVGEIPESTMKIASYMKSLKNVNVREINMKDFNRELRTFLDIFNSAWSKNWGFIPMTEDEIDKTARDLRLIIDPNLAIVVEIDGVPAGMALSLPNINEALSDLKGRLFPIGIFKLLYRLKIKGLKTARCILLGIKKDFRASDELPGLAVLLYTEMHGRGKSRGYTSGELSWTLEDNVKINNGIELMGGIKYKTYRIFEKTI